MHQSKDSITECCITSEPSSISANTQDIKREIMLLFTAIKFLDREWYLRLDRTQLATVSCHVGVPIISDYLVSMPAVLAHSQLFARFVPTFSTLSASAVFGRLLFPPLSIYIIVASRGLGLMVCSGDGDGAGAASAFESCMTFRMVRNSDRTLIIEIWPTGLGARSGDCGEEEEKKI